MDPLLALMNAHNKKILEDKVGRTECMRNETKNMNGCNWESRLMYRSENPWYNSSNEQQLQTTKQD